MTDLSGTHPLAIERSCALTAVALSDRRRAGARLITGQNRSFSLNANLSVVHVPYPAAGGWTRRTLTCPRPPARRPASMTGKLRVIQCATGNVGRHAVAAVRAHRDLELVGVLVYTDEKAGRDVGE